MKFPVTSWFKLLFIFSLTVSLLLGQVSLTKAQSSNPDMLVQQGVTEYQNQAYQAAIASWQQALEEYREQKDNSSTVIVLENLARAYQQVGQPEQAIAILCNQLPNDFAVPQAKDQPECREGSAIKLAQDEGDKLGEVAALGSLGEAYRLRGNYQQALKYAKQSLSTAQLEDNPQLTMSALNSLGNIYSSLAQVSYRRADSAARRGETYGENSLFTREIKKAQERDRQALDYFAQNLELAREQNNSLAQVRSSNS